jgi:pullulanase-type alpha-1,6-glucosidase
MVVALASGGAAEPTSVTVAGSLQSELGCPDDWQPDCAVTHLAFDATDRVWQASFGLPAGDFEYKAALNNSWDVNYGANATPNGANISLSLAAPSTVKFYYDSATHWIADNHNKVIATAPGSYQSELGCPGDWQPDCLRSWLEDPDGDGIYRFSTGALPAGAYEVKVAINESWDENYGLGGVQNGPNIPFTVATDCAITEFSYDPVTHLLDVGSAMPPPQPASVTVAGSLQSELGCSDDWQPACAATHLVFDATDGVWQASFAVPAGSWEYKAPLNDSWDENYGLNASRNGPNIPLNLASPATVKFYYDHATHWITDNRTKIIATAAGSFQSELGCPGDWQPDCLRSWLEDPDGDGIYTFTTHSLPAGSYEVKVAINESWDENYGAGGVPGGANIPFTVPASCAEIFFSYDASTHLLTVSAAGAPRGNISRAQAYWVKGNTIAWNAGPDPASSIVELHYDPVAGLVLEPTGVTGGTAIPLVYDPAGLDADTRAKFPHLATLPAFRIPPARLAEVREALKSQIVVSAKASDGTLLDATALQIPGALDDLYTYRGPLGPAVAAGGTTLRLWAPTARSVKLHLFADALPSTLATVLDMTEDPATGVWSIVGSPGWEGRYYLFEVEVFARATGKIEHNLVTDPYSVGLSRNSQRSEILRLDVPALKPPGWDHLAKPKLAAPEDIVLYELHVRDFSASDESVPEAIRGTFLAFTQSHSDGMRHLSRLARAGLTHVHLLPAFDIATINEDKSTWQQPAGDLAILPPDSNQQQAAVRAVADADPFNWGYDPWHYTVPEGSYATDADGTARVREFRQMVQALNRTGLRVVMDVVYNHTNAAGEDPHSVLDRIVPGYYHRLNADGNVENSTCCSNTASEHNMMEKLLIDSVLTWATQYKVDGFRFDLMGHHLKRNMTALRQALDALTPEHDGVDGKKVYLYGEGWNFGEVANNARGVNATQLNMAGTGIGTFNDRIRDGARGGGPFSGLQEQGFLTGLYDDPNATAQGTPADQKDRLLHEMDWIRVGVAGNLADFELVDQSGNRVHGRDIDYNGQPAGYTADPQEVISYVEAHDNETLFDAIQAKAAPTASLAERVRMQNLGMSLVLFGEGVPFLHAGVELLRSKSLDRNSYNSGDWFNKLDFTYQSNNWGVGLPPAPDNQSNWPIIAPLLANPALQAHSADIHHSAAHLAEALGVRRSSRLFRLRTAADVESRLTFHNTGPLQIPGLLAYSLSDPDGSIDRGRRRLVVLLNATKAPVALYIPELAHRNLSLHPLLAASDDPLVRTSGFVSSSGTFTVPRRTAAVFVEQRPPAEQIGLLLADVDRLRSNGTLSGGQAFLLRVPLRAAEAAIASGRPGLARLSLGAFTVLVRGFEAGGILPDEEAAALLEAAASLLDTL